MICEFFDVVSNVSYWMPSTGIRLKNPVKYMEMAFRFANRGFSREICSGVRFSAIGLVIIRSGSVFRYAVTISATIIAGL